MKYLKQYEEINQTEPKVDDFVICEEENTNIDDVKIVQFTKNNIGQIMEIKGTDIYKFRIKYDNVPDDLSYKLLLHNDVYTRPMAREEIKYWSADKNELLPLLTANKYNL